MSEKTDGSLVVVVILVVPLVAARQGKKGDFGRSQGRCSCRASCVIEKKVEGEEEVDRAREDLVGDRKEKEIGSSADSFISDQHPSNTFLFSWVRWVCLFSSSFGDHTRGGGYVWGGVDS